MKEPTFTRVRSGSDSTSCLSPGAAAVMIAWLAVVLLTLTGRRRPAATVACVPLVLGLTDLLVLRTGDWSVGLPLFFWTAFVGPVVLASLAVCSLAFSAGPRRGLAIAGKRRACLMVAVLSVGSLVSLDGQLPALAVGLLDVLAIAVAVTRVPGTAGGRVAALMTTGLLLNLAGTIPFAGRLTADAVLVTGHVLITMLVWPLAIMSWKRRVSRA